MVRVRRHRLRDGLVGRAAHDVRIRVLEEIELRRVIGLAVFGHAEAELPEVGVGIGQQAVERVVEDRRDQRSHDSAPSFEGRMSSRSSSHRPASPSASRTCGLGCGVATSRRSAAWRAPRGRAPAAWQAWRRARPPGRTRRGCLVFPPTAWRAAHRAPPPRACQRSGRRAQRCDRQPVAPAGSVAERASATGPRDGGSPVGPMRPAVFIGTGGSARSRHAAAAMNRRTPASQQRPPRCGRSIADWRTRPGRLRCGRAHGPTMHRPDRDGTAARARIRRSIAGRHGSSRPAAAPAGRSGRVRDPPHHRCHRERGPSAAAHGPLVSAEGFAGEVALQRE